MRFRLPRWTRGSAITHDRLNAIVELVERAANWEVDPGSGLELLDTTSGRVLRLVSPTFAKTFVVTTALTPGNGGNTPGVGAGTMQQFNAASGTFVPTALTGVSIYNESGIGIIVGAYVQCVFQDGCWFYDLTKCSNGASS